MLSEEHLARLMADGRRPKPRSLWEWVRYGREGPPKHEARRSADADADADAEGRAADGRGRQHRDGRAEKD